jgi:hypothetical protein
MARSDETGLAIPHELVQVGGGGREHHHLDFLSVVRADLTLFALTAASTGTHSMDSTAKKWRVS